MIQDGSRNACKTKDGFVHHELNISDRKAMLELFSTLKPSVVVHTAAQPFNDKAASIPSDDFDTNTVGSLNILEASRQSCPESPIFTCLPTRSMETYLFKYQRRN